MSTRDTEASNRFTISDYNGYAYGGDEDEDASNKTPNFNASVSKPPRALIASRRPHPLEPSISSRREGKQPEINGSGIGSGRSASSSGIRPLPRIPSISTSTSPISPVAGPSSPPISTSPIGISPSQSVALYKSPISSSRSSYFTLPPTARTSSGKGKQPDYGNATGTQTRPERNGSGGSSHYKLQLHEVSLT
jgi:hypothetical protein